MAYDVWQSCMLVPGISRAECASWAQALISAAAVVAGAVGLNWQVRKQARLHEEAKTQEEVRLLKIIGQFVFEARARLRCIEEEDMPHRHDDWASIEAAVASIRAVSLDRYPAEQAAFDVANALLSYTFMLDAYQGVGPSKGALHEVERINKSRQRAVALFFEAEKSIEGALRMRRSQLARTEIDFGWGVVIRTLKKDPVHVG